MDKPFQYQLLPGLTQDEYQALKDDIARRGVQVPIEFDENQNVLDGHHRLQICAELGIKDYPSIVRVGMSEDEKFEHVLALNLDRRHLSREQRQELHAMLRAKGWSLRRIAERTGTTEATVHRDLSTVTNVTVPERIIGKDGKNRPARKPAVFNKNRQDAQRTFSALETLPTNKLPEKNIDPKRLSRIAREQAAQERRESAIIKPPANPELQILFGDFREISDGIETESIDLIFTDPPYPEEFLPLWSDLSRIASRILKPGGLLVAYSGQYHLPNVMGRLAEFLEYVWLGSILLRGPHNEVHARHIHNHSKPLLFYGKEYQPNHWFTDTYSSEGRTKDIHEWQQAEGAAIYYIETLTKPGNMVFDPFLGSGTTASAAVKTDRSFIGCDIDRRCVLETINRIENDPSKSL